MSRLAQRMRRGLLRHGGLPLVWLALTVVTLIPLWSVRIFPALQAPADMAMARIWHSLGDPSYRLASHYAWGPLWVPGTLYYVLMDLLLGVFPMPVAHRIVLSIYVIGFPLALRSLARALGRSDWLALSGFVLVFNRNWVFGYTGFLLGMALCLYGWAQTIDFVASVSAPRLMPTAPGLMATAPRLTVSAPRLMATAPGLMKMVALAGALYWANPLALLAFVAGQLGIVSASPGSIVRKYLGKILLVAAPWLMLLAAAIARELAEPHSRMSSANLEASFTDLPGAMISLPGRMLSLFPGALDYNVLWILAVTVLMLWWRSGWKAPPRTLIGLLAGVAVAYLLLPWSVANPVWLPNLGGRLAPLFACLLALLPATEESQNQKGLRRIGIRALSIPINLGAVILSLRLLVLYIGFDSRHAAFLRLLTELPRGSSTLVIYRGVRLTDGRLDESGDPASSAPVYRYFVDLPEALMGGYAPDLLEVGGPIVVTRRLQTPGPVVPDEFTIRMAPEYDYFLVRFPSEEMLHEPALKMIDQLGEWTLFHRQFDFSEEP